MKKKTAYTANIEFAIKDSKQIKTFLQESLRLLKENDSDQVQELLKKALIKAKLLLISTADVKFD